MRIVAGSHRGRPLAAPADARIRPTADRVREALFNILRHRLGGLEGSRLLDGFAGTGALGLEALSQGAAFATFVDKDRDALAICRRNAAALGLSDRAHFQQCDLTRLGPGALAGWPFDLVLLDPPYGKGLGAAALAALSAGGYLAPGALAVIEADRATPEAAPEGFTVVDTRDYGRARLALLASV
jgi:16S rRNA (guanine966-N2)-methyltransferase